MADEDPTRGEGPSLPGVGSDPNEKLHGMMEGGILLGYPATSARLLTALARARGGGGELLTPQQLPEVLGLAIESDARVPFLSGGRRAYYHPELMEDLREWAKESPDAAYDVVFLCEMARRDPFAGPGNPRRLFNVLDGAWSRRISGPHRLVYRVAGDRIDLLIARIRAVPPGEEEAGEPDFETLDPEDWDACRALGHRMVDEMLDHLRTVRDRPVWRPIPEAVSSSFHEPLPGSPMPAEEVYEAFRERVLPYPTGNVHPRFWGWVMGTGTPGAMLSEMLAAGLNLNQGGGAQSGALVERQVIDWCKEMLSFPASASGILVSGGSMANLVGMTVARNSKAGFDLRGDGVDPGRGRLVAYASTEVHSSVPKAMELLGLGRQALRQVPALADDTIDLAALRAAIASDREAGHVPFLVVGCAGTVSTGAVDPLDSLADLCAEEGTWFHVDGAFGALAALSPDLKPLLRGMERADSLAFDMHKWMFLPYEIGCTLVRDQRLHRGAFALSADYLEHTARGIGGGDLWFSDYGVELSRGFRALKAWMALKEHGVPKIGRIIRRNVEQARALGELVAADPDLELLAPVALNVVCFRYRGGVEGEEALEALNRELLLRLHEGGLVAPSNATVRGRYALRACITNHRTRGEDLELLCKETVRLGRELAASA